LRQSRRHELRHLKQVSERCTGLRGPREFRLRWRVRVRLNRVFRLNVSEFEGGFIAVGASDDEFEVFLCSLGHVTDAHAADIVGTATRHKNRVEIQETHWTAVSEFFLFLPVFWVLLATLNVLLSNVGLDSNFVASSNLGQQTWDVLLSFSKRLASV